ncbi:MAG: ADP compounds hydrolase NudE, partial [Candidatus Baumannia cicadellinicola]|nr:ADP compounds hydrolase NudE [Candidatus Baumannia cicadellinicola]
TIAPSYLSNTMNIVVAQKLYPHKKIGDEPEKLSLVRWPVTQMLALLNEIDFCEARNISALFLTHSWLE